MKNHHGRRLYSLVEVYGILYHAMRILPYFRKVKKNGILNGAFRERLMLAVTEVNGCVLCSYGHTQKALESGISLHEINEMLSGEFADIPQEELPAILFAQHYADSRGKPTKDAWNRILQLYDKPKINAILATVSLIMAGNAYGIPLGSLKGRFKESPKNRIDQRSSLPYEIAILLLIIIFVPLASMQAVVAFLIRRPMINFK